MKHHHFGTLVRTVTRWSQNFYRWHFILNFMISFPLYYNRNNKTTDRLPVVPVEVG